MTLADEFIFAPIAGSHLPSVVLLACDTHVAVQVCRDLHLRQVPTEPICFLQQLKKLKQMISGPKCLCNQSTMRYTDCSCKL